MQKSSTKKKSPKESKKLLIDLIKPEPNMLWLFYFYKHKQRKEVVPCSYGQFGSLSEPLSFTTSAKEKAGGNTSLFYFLRRYATTVITKKKRKEVAWMSNRTAHRLAKKAMLRARMGKEARKWAHKCVHMHINGVGFDQWQLIEADRAMFLNGFNAACACREELVRNWIDQPD